MDMHFLGNIKQLCEVCKVKRYKEEVLKYLYKEKILMIFYEPTQNLHLKDIEVQKNIMKQMLENGNTIIVIEHSLDFILDANYILDMEPVLEKWW